MTIDWNTTHAAVWRSHSASLRAVRNIDPIGLDELIGIERQKERLLRNSERFLRGEPANNALLWGSRGTGKSSLIKAVFNHFKDDGLRLIEVDKDDLLHLPEIVDEIRDRPQRFIIFCDDLSFEAGERGYKALKSILEGSVELPPENVLLYATSNRRHLMPEYMSENQGTQLVDGELHYTETVEEKISLSDRFGLWLSFYPVDMTAYLAVVDHLFADYPGDREALHEAARAFAMTRGAHSPRTARQFYNDYYRRG